MHISFLKHKSPWTSETEVASLWLVKLLQGNWCKGLHHLQIYHTPWHELFMSVVLRSPCQVLQPLLRKGVFLSGPLWADRSQKKAAKSRGLVAPKRVGSGQFTVQSICLFTAPAPAPKQVFYQMHVILCLSAAAIASHVKTFAPKNKWIENCTKLFLFSCDGGILIRHFFHFLTQFRHVSSGTLRYTLSAGRKMSRWEPAPRCLPKIGLLFFFFNQCALHGPCVVQIISFKRFLDAFSLKTSAF